MPLIVVKDAVPTVAPGTYLATVIAVTEKSLVTKFSKDGKPDDFLEWTWDINGEEVRSLTSVASGPKSRTNEYLVALFGANKVNVGAGFDEKDLVGKSAMVQIVLNEEGFSKVDRVMAAPAGGAKAKATEAQPITEAEAAAEAATVPDELPF
jgi:hypothetical protein